MQISVKADVKTVQRQLNRIQKRQIPFATSLALNRTADKAKDDLYGSMKRYFKKPTKQVLNQSLRTQYSKKTNLRSQVYAVPWADEFLQYQAYGGTERKKGPRLVAPVDQANVNAYGNIKGKRNNLIKSGMYYAKTKSGKDAVWRKRGRGKNAKLRLQYVFKDSMQYRRIWPYERVAERSVARYFPKFMIRALNKALATAR